MGTGEGSKGDIYRSREQSGGRRAVAPRCLAPNGSDSIQALAFGLPGSGRSALTCGNDGTLYVSADFFFLSTSGRACVCLRVSRVCACVPDSCTPPGLGFPRR